MSKAILLPVAGQALLMDFSTLEDYQLAVGGLIDVFATSEGGNVYFNDNGKALGLPRNLRATQILREAGCLPGDFLAGPAIIVGSPGGDGYETDVTPYWIDRLNPLGGTDA